MRLKDMFSMLKNCRDEGKDINVNELLEIIKTNPNSILLDVRSIQEFNEGHLKRSN